MNKLKHLVNTIRHENRLSTEELLVTLLTAIEEAENNTDMSTKDVYIDIYRKAYGNTLTKDIAEEWVMSMEVTDGSGRINGQKWNFEQTTEVGNSIGIDWGKINKIDWYVVMNMEYAKHYTTAKMYGMEEDPSFFAHIAKDEWCNSSESVFDYYVDTEL